MVYLLKKHYSKIETTWKHEVPLLVCLEHAKVGNHQLPWQHHEGPGPKPPALIAVHKVRHRCLIGKVVGIKGVIRVFPSVRAPERREHHFPSVRVVQRMSTKQRLRSTVHQCLDPICHSDDWPENFLGVNLWFSQPNCNWCSIHSHGRYLPMFAQHMVQISARIGFALACFGQLLQERWATWVCKRAGCMVDLEEHPMETQAPIVRDANLRCKSNDLFFGLFQPTMRFCKFSLLILPQIQHMEI